MQPENKEKLIVDFPIIDVADNRDYLVLANSPIGPLIPEVGRELAWLNFAGADAVTTGQEVPLFANADLLQVIGDRVAIDAAGADAEALLVDLEALGLKNGVVFGNLVSGLMPIEAIDEIANLESLGWVWSKLVDSSRTLPVVGSPQTPLKKGGFRKPPLLQGGVWGGSRCNKCMTTPVWG